MNCTDFRAAISDAVERRSPPAAEAAAHLEVCPDPVCKRCWEDAALLDRAIARWRIVATAEQSAVADRIVAACQADMQGASRRPEPTAATASARQVLRASTQRHSATSRGWAALSVAALVLVALFALLPRDRELLQRNVARRGPGLSPAASRSRIAENHSTDPGLAYVAYAQDAVQFMTDAVVMTVGDRSEMEDPKLSPPELGWESAWPPIEEGMQNALHGLLESLPAEAPHG